MSHTPPKATGSRKPQRQIRSIAFAGDFLRFTPTADGWQSGQTQNIAWLHELIGTLPLWQDAGVRVAVPSAGPTINRLRQDTSPGSAWEDYCDNAEIAWARRYDSADCEDFSAFVDELASHDLVVGFELPPALKEQLHTRQAAYVSFCIHPIRFLRDLAFGVTTNVPGIAKRLDALRIDNAVVDAEVRRFRAMLTRNEPTALSLPPGLPLLAGQTERDSILIDAGGFADWSQYLDELALALEPYPEVILLEHPLRSSSTDIVDLIWGKLHKTVISTDANSYGVMFAARSAVPQLLTLASSLGVEAEAIGIPVRFLLADPRQKLCVPGIDVGPIAFVGHAVLTNDFWRGVLGQTTTKPRPSAPFELGDNHLRDGLPAWAFQPLRYGFDGLKTRKVFVPSSALALARRNEIITDLLPPAAGSQTSIEHAKRAARGFGVNLVVSAAPIFCGEQMTIQLGGPGAKQHLPEGFWRPEDWGTWSNSLRCAIAVPVSDAADAAGAQLRITLPVLLLDALRASSPVLRVSSGDTVLGYAMFRPGGPNPIEITATILARAPQVQLDLELSRMGRHDEGSDRRWLGIAVTSLTLECSAESPSLPASAGSPCIWGIEMAMPAEHHAAC